MSNLRSARLVGIGAIAGIALSLGLSALAERGNTGRSVLPLDELRQFSEVFGTIKAYYVEPVKDSKLITDAISGMLTGLDPHSAYLDENAFRELQVSTQGEFGGLGIEIGTEDGFIKVVSPIEDTPAAKAGVKAGDLIIKIGDTPTKDMRLDEAVKMMRGKPKSPITLTLQRKGVADPIVLTIMRDIIQVQSVRSKLLEPGIGYVRVSQFQEHTVNNLIDHLEQLARKNAGPLRSVVLDLRNDPGGLLHGAIGVSAAFLQPGMEVTSTDGRTEDAKRSFYASPQDYMASGGKADRISTLPAWTKTAKMTVLVNAGSASASEIVAGALQDHKRAIVLGTQTFGKGSVQTILPLAGQRTAIKLTTARYYTPNGRSIQARGIVPDYVVEESADGDINGFRIREADLQRHLSNDRDTTPEVKSSAPTSADQQRLKHYKPVELGVPANDFQLQQALNYLHGRTIQKAPPEQRLADGKTAPLHDDKAAAVRAHAAEGKAMMETKDKAGQPGQATPAATGKDGH
ncbi:MAG: S41 family peptidase [Lautropia sp.]|nr:S41 family peptidase [Lautropia sp.]